MIFVAADDDHLFFILGRGNYDNRLVFEAWGSLSDMTTATLGLGLVGSGGRGSSSPLMGVIAFIRVTVLRK